MATIVLQVLAMYGRFEPHCHLTGLVTAEDAVSLCDRWPIGSDVEVAAGGHSVLALARQGAVALRPHWCMRPVPTGALRGLSAWRRFQAHADVVSQFLVHSGENPRRAQQRLFGVSGHILERGVERWQRHDVAQAEVRVHLGAAAPAVRESYVQHLFDTAERLSGKHFLLRIRCTLPRLGWRLMIDQVLATCLQRPAYWAGWDFSGEEIDPEQPEEFSHLPAPIAAGKSIHAGEQLAGPRPWFDALRHCHQAVRQWGAHRLGHAAILGLDPRQWLGRSWQWQVPQKQRTESWLSAFFPSYHDQMGPWANDQGTYDQSMVESMQALQAAVVDDLMQQQAVIETCPTSNARIVGGEGFGHPLPGLLAHGLHLVVGSDDPGILGTSIPNEHRRARALGWMGS